MTQQILKNNIINTLTNLDIEYLSNLNDDFMFSNLTKTEIIEEFTYVINMYKSQGISSLRYQRSSCNYY